MSKKLAQATIPDSWTSSKLGDLLDFKNGLNKEKDAFGTGTPIVNYTDVYKKTSLKSSDVKGLVTVSKSELVNNGVNQGDVFFTRTSETLEEIGLASVLLEHIDDCVFSGYILRGRPKTKDVLPKYWAHSLRTPNIRNEIKKKSSMTTRALTSGKSLSAVNYAYPPQKEQKNIIKILDTWDEVIVKLSQAITLKREIKKGLMQKLLTGDLRLSGFNSEWKKYTLNDLYEITSSKRVFESEWTAEGVPFYRAREIVKLANHGFVKNELFISRDMFDDYKSKYGAPKESDLLITGVGTIGRVYRVRENDEFYFKDGNIVWLKHKDGVSSEFIEQLFSTRNIQKQVIGSSPITTVATYTIDAAKKTKVIIPDFEEQTAIAGVLMTFDAEINLLIKKKKIFQDQKNYLLNNLVTGKIRTPENL